MIYLMGNVRKKAPDLKDIDLQTISAPDLMVLSGYKHSDHCTICTAKDNYGQPARGMIEEIYGKSGLQRAVWYMESIGVTLSPRQLQRHIQTHAPYVRAGLFMQRTQKMIKDAIKDHADAETAVQTIVNIGTKMVTTGEIPVTGKMYMEALKLATKEKERGTFDGFIKSVEGQVFDGEIVEHKQLPGKTDNTPSPVYPLPEDVGNSENENSGSDSVEVKKE